MSDPRREFMRAKQALARATVKLAKASKPKSTALGRRGPAWVERLLRRHGPELSRQPGVVGFAFGPRHRGGDPVAEDCLVIFVRKKLARRELKGRILPRKLSHKGRSLPTDVVQLNAFRKLAAPGSAKLTPSDLTSPGTLGCYGTDLDTSCRVALTAMHVVDADTASVDVIDGTRRLLGEVLTGTTSGLDAAKVSVLHPAEVRDSIAGIGPINGWREALDPEDRDTAVRLRGAATGLHRGSVLFPRVALPGVGIERAIVTDLVVGKGDSGAALVDLEGFVLGLLMGDALFGERRLSIFSPADLVVDRCRCTIP